MKGNNYQANVEITNKKEEFVSPEAEIIVFEACDVITTSGGLNPQDEGYGEEHDW